MSTAVVGTDISDGMTLVLPLPPKLDGTMIVRTVLSALADTSIVADGLNFKAVGGKECALRILSSG